MGKAMSTAESQQSSVLTSLIGARQAALKLSNQDLATATGFDHESALRLIKQGAMRLPLTKVPAMAVALELDPVELFTLVLGASDPALLQVIEAVFNPLRLTATEVTLLGHLRKLSGERQGTPTAFDGQSVMAMLAVNS
jgi:hypothetical protein